MLLRTLLQWAARLDRVGLAATRFGLVLVLVWIGGLKVFKYEADGIIPFVANSPFFSFLTNDPGNYKSHMNPEGKLVPENREWHEKNGTYTFSYGLGALIVFYGVLIAMNPWFPTLGALGSFLVVTMSIVTLSFLVTTPECWVPDLGDTEHGFPYLSGRGRLVVKDAIMFGAAMVTMADSAKSALLKSSNVQTAS
ncbi:MAG TPA: DUF417 family protein [Planctomicrobium sp.]|nr:DUF417 family protein [Planctomicrobium sp.]